MSFDISATLFTQPRGAHSTPASSSSPSMPVSPSISWDDPVANMLSPLLILGAVAIFFYVYGPALAHLCGCRQLNRATDDEEAPAVEHPEIPTLQALGMIH